MYRPEREKYQMLERANEPQLPLWIRIGDWIAVLVLVIAVLFAVTGCAPRSANYAVLKLDGVMEPVTCSLKVDTTCLQYSEVRIKPRN